MDLISVIIPTYNLEHVIETCILSIINQTYKNLEIIVVDDGSSDSTGDIVGEITKNDDRVQYYRNENHGAGYSYNYGIDKAKGEYIYILDGDNFIEENMLEVLYGNLVKNDCDMVTCGYIYDEYDNGSYRLIRESVNKELRTTNFNEYMGEFLFLYSNHLMNSPCNHLYTRKLIGEKRFEEDRLKVGTVDTDFNTRLLEDVNKFSHVPFNFVHYVQYPKESHQLTNGWKTFDKNKILLISELLSKIKHLYEQSDLDLDDYYRISVQHLSKFAFIIANSKISKKTKYEFFEQMSNIEPFHSEMNFYPTNSKINRIVIEGFKSGEYKQIIRIARLKKVVEKMPISILNKIRNGVNKKMVS